MKKFLSIMALLPFMINSIHLTFASWDIEVDKKFIVTAYYSPLPNQEFYLRWNYEAEKRLNWEWKYWASGKAVYVWMLAAPKTYKFWTKIFLKWVWIGVVDDRWWAIVSSWNRWYDGDRIDIWMWYWEEWLRRALSWWKRTVYWKILTEKSDMWLPELALENFHIQKINTLSINNSWNIWKSNSIKASEEINIVPYSITKNSSKNSIEYFQKIMKSLGYYSWEINWIFDSNLSELIFEFQLDNNVVSSKDERWAYYYWIKTRQTLKEKYSKFLAEEKMKIEFEKKQQEKLAILDSKISSIIKSLWMPEENEIGNHVRKLQKTLKALGYFEWKDTAIYWEMTKESIMAFQIKNSLILTSTDQWAGKIGEKTLSKIQEELKNRAIFDETIIDDINL